MCRLLAYLGPPVPLADVLLEPEHSLVVQSYAPREMTSGVVNADGFGFAWYDRAVRDEPFAYRSILPIWNDANLPSLGAYVRSGCVLANVRSATPGQALDFSNTQPFVHGRLAVLHNGFVEDYRKTLHRRLLGELPDEALDLVRGSTDSEHLSAWLLHHVAAGPTLADGVAAALASLRTVAAGARMTLNFIVGDGERFVAARAAIGVPAPTLYVLRGHARFPEATLVASEPLFDRGAWMPCPEGSLVAVGPGRPAEFVALAA